MWHLYSREYLEFCVARDAWLMFEGLNDADPFIGHPPCFAHPPNLCETAACTASLDPKTSVCALGR